ncbi:MAG: YlxM family DNA-binding protein [Fusobacteriota bacterium]
MELDDFFEVSILLTYYKNLLSNKQSIYMTEYFENDLSLTEIGDKYNVTRQAVYENIKKGSSKLKDYEKKLGFYKKESLIKHELEKLKNNFNEKKLEIILKKFQI